MLIPTSGLNPQKDNEKYVTEITANDILLGRGAGPNEHAGNVTFREIVAKQKKKYMATTNRQVKNKIAHKTVRLIKAQKGRFLQKVKGQDDDIYEIADEKVVLEKTKQALRHVDRARRRKAEASNTADVDECNKDTSSSPASTSILQASSGIRQDYLYRSESLRDAGSVAFGEGVRGYGSTATPTFGVPAPNLAASFEKLLAEQEASSALAILANSGRDKLASSNSIFRLLENESVDEVRRAAIFLQQQSTHIVNQCTKPIIERHFLPRSSFEDQLCSAERFLGGQNEVLAPLTELILRNRLGPKCLQQPRPLARPQDADTIGTILRLAQSLQR